MIDYRPFRNTDPPALCEIWRSHAPLRAFFQPLTPPILETTVLSRPFFDREGLIVAVEDGEPIGFVHAGFGRDQDGSFLDTSIGATCMLLVSNPQQRPQVGRELLARSEQYLQHRGAVDGSIGGGSQLMAPFYLGLYGGTHVPGILATDSAQLELFTAAGYRETGRRSIMQRQIAGFRPVVDRHQIQLKRNSLVESFPDPCSTCWWEACTSGLNDRYCFSAKNRLGDECKATAVFWDIEPLASSWGCTRVGSANSTCRCRRIVKPWRCSCWVNHCD